jgi:hypothetical protein
VTLVFHSPPPLTPTQAVQDYRTRLIDTLTRHANAYCHPDEADFYTGLRAAITIIEKSTP